jgi:putative hydrolase of the HAD superfamily
MGAFDALLIDAHGTLVTLEPPAPRLRVLVRERYGVDVGTERASAAIGAEIAYYRNHLAEGRDPASLARLRARSAEVLLGALGHDEVLTGIASDEAVTLLLDALAFRAYDDALPALAAARALGMRIVVVSNWDCSLPETLEAVGLLPAVDAVVASAAFGAAKPDPALFVEGLRVAGVDPERALHVGDSVTEDVAGALAAGVEPVLIVRSGERPPSDVRSVRSLSELPAMLRPAWNHRAGRGAGASL